MPVDLAVVPVGRTAQADLERIPPILQPAARAAARVMAVHLARPASPRMAGLAA
jgi:hypothetical protein